MIKVCFRVNLGSMDADRLDLDFRKCTAGAVVSIPETVAKVLESAGIIEPVAWPAPQPKPEPVEVRADPVAEAEVKSDPVVFRSEAIPEATDKKKK